MPRLCEPGETFLRKVLLSRRLKLRGTIEGADMKMRFRRPGEAFASQGRPASGAKSAPVQIVATIVAINKSKKTVDLKGPDGVVETVNVAKPSNLKHVKVGDDIIITLTKVVAIKLEKESEA